MIKPTSNAMRWLLLAASALVFVAGFQLFVLSEQTDTFFAWTIKSPLTAAFLGAGYWASVVLEYRASRERWWANARIAVPAVLSFTALTLLVTLIHFDPPFRAHLNSPNALTVAATAGWLAIYASVPVVMSGVLILQLRAPGADPSRQAALPNWLKAALAIHGAMMLVMGAALFVWPDAAGAVWPWKLTTLTGRAVGAWLLGIGLAAAQVTIENDWRRLVPIFAAYPVLGALQLVALARYGQEVSWGTASAAIYLLFWLSVLAVGLYGWRHSRTAISHDL